MKTFVEVGIKEGLKGKMLVEYIDYMEIRWKQKEEIQCQKGYAGEWARRFKEGIEYAASDIGGQGILDRMRGA